MPNAIVIDSSMLALDLADRSPPCALGSVDYADKENIPPNAYRARKGGGGTNGAPKRRTKATTKRRAAREAAPTAAAAATTTRSTSAKAVRPPEGAVTKAKFKARGPPDAPRAPRRPHHPSDPRTSAHLPPRAAAGGHAAGELAEPAV